MNTITNYIDRLKKMTGSDNKTAAKLGVKKQTISAIRLRNAVSEDIAEKISENLGEPLEKVLISAAIARNTGKTREAWERVARVMGYLMIVLSITQGIKRTFVKTSR